MLRWQRSTTIMLGFMLAGLPVYGTGALAQELSIEIPVEGRGHSREIGGQRKPLPELPKSSGFEELTAPDEPPLPYIEDNSETIVLPPPANAAKPAPAKPAAKVPAKPAAKAPAKPVVKTPAKPVVKAPAKPVVKTQPVTPPKAAVKPKVAVPLPRAKPKSIVKPPRAAKKPVAPKAPTLVTLPPKAPKTDPARAEEIPFIGVEVGPKANEPRAKPGPTAPTPLVKTKTAPIPEVKSGPIAPIPLVDAPAAPATIEPEIVSGPIAPVSTLKVAPDAEQTTMPKAGKSDRIDRN